MADFDFLSGLGGASGFPGLLGLHPDWFQSLRSMSSSPVAGSNDATPQLPAASVGASGASAGPPLQNSSASGPDAPAGPANDASLGGFLGGVRDKINANSNALLGFASGLAGGRSWADGLSKGFAGAAQGAQADAKPASQQDLYNALVKNNVPREQAIAAIRSGNSDVLKFMLQKYGKGISSSSTTVVPQL